MYYFFFCIFSRVTRANHEPSSQRKARCRTPSTTSGAWFGKNAHLSSSWSRGCARKTGYVHEWRHIVFINPQSCRKHVLKYSNSVLDWLNPTSGWILKARFMDTCEIFMMFTTLHPRCLLLFNRCLIKLRVFVSVWVANNEITNGKCC